MLKMRWMSIVDRSSSNVTTIRHRDDLQVRNLLDDPRLRRACGLDPEGHRIPKVRPHPQLRFDRRRLLDAAAA